MIKLQIYGEWDVSCMNFCYFYSMLKMAEKVKRNSLRIDFYSKEAHAIHYHLVQLINNKVKLSLLLSTKMIKLN